MLSSKWSYRTLSRSYPQICHQVLLYLSHLGDKTTWPTPLRQAAQEAEESEAQTCVEHVGLIWDSGVQDTVGCQLSPRSSHLCVSTKKIQSWKAHVIFEGIGILGWLDIYIYIFIYIYLFIIYLFICIHTSSPPAGIIGEQCYRVLGKEDEEFHPVMWCSPWRWWFSIPAARFHGNLRGPQGHPIKGNQWLIVP